MTQRKNSIRKRVSIRRRFLITVLLTTIISIVSVSLTGYLCIRWIRRSTEQTLKEQLEINQKNVIEEMASTVDAKLVHYQKYVDYTVDYIEYMYAHEEEMISRGEMIYAPTDTTEYMMTRAFASVKLTEEELQDEILFFSNLRSIWEPIAKENEDVITSVYLGAKSGLMVSYDSLSYLSAQPEGKELIYNYFVSEWYKKGISEEKPFCTGIYMDFQGRGLTITMGSGIKDKKGEVKGVFCIEFDLSSLYDELFSSSLDNDTFIFTLDRDETIISHDSDMIDLKEYTGLTLDQLDALKVDPDGIMVENDSVYVSVPLERVGWTMCARVPVDAIQNSIHNADKNITNAAIVFIIVVILILIAAVIAVNRTVRTITYPLELLRKDIKKISDGDLKYRAPVYQNDEIGDITSGMNEMVDRLNFTLNELMSSQQQADAMSRLATTDALTGIRNKTAFDRQLKILQEEFEKGEKEFGFALLDLNNLKIMNDNFGHDKGDIAIKKLSHIICEVFSHSPVFRIGGDEFIVLLKNDDYHNIKKLVKTFKEEIRLSSENTGVEPWDRTSAAVGYALYDEKLDDSIESVQARADKEMYKCKKAMKEGRK